MCVLSPSGSQLMDWPTPLLIVWRIYTHPGQPPLGRYSASLIVTSMTLPHQDRPAFLLSPFPWFPLGSLPPLSFWGKHLSKTGLIFALISNLKRLLMPESLAFSSFFPCLAETDSVSRRDGIMSQLLVVHKPPVFSLPHFKERSSGETLFFGLGVWALAFQSSLSPFALLSASQPS